MLIACVRPTKTGCPLSWKPSVWEAARLAMEPQGMLRSDKHLWTAACTLLTIVMCIASRLAVCDLTSVSKPQHMVR